MSGVNAHAVLSSAEAAAKAEHVPGLIWQRARHWIAPAQHAMLSRCKSTAGGRLHIVAKLGSASLAFLYNHQVLQLYPAVLELMRILLLAVMFDSMQKICPSTMPALMTPCLSQVQGRALCAGAAMFEMGTAAGASLSAATSGAQLLLSQASIAAPCQLNVPELSCLISPRYIYVYS